ncbi:hypothetical protein [Burkholderia anthina]|uniref:hypothetical protein n=1 Tax=Burkholderia anthina TaxID=179879 RepID=UPI0012DAD9E4|nr:hypothetical protein [Burkholderia anthina]
MQPAADDGHRPLRPPSAEIPPASAAGMRRRYTFASRRRAHARRATRQIGRLADFHASRSRFKIFLTNESSCAVSIVPCTFSRENRQFIAPDTREKRIARIPRKRGGKYG